MNSVLLIFIDGLGLGEADAQINPLFRFDPPIFRTLLGGPLAKGTEKNSGALACLVPTDATLGVDGLPQSATGQTALFTGINAAQEMGRHIMGFPGPTLGRIIAEHGIMKELVEAGYLATSANMYTPNYMELVASRQRRHSATTLTTLGAGLKLRSLAEMASHAAVYQDITNESLPQFGVEGVPVIDPAEAGRRLIQLASVHHFTMFEYFQTDRCGHKGNWSIAEQIVGVLDRFLHGVVEARPRNMLVIITSDHGNFEDLSRKTHTLSPVPTIVFGEDCRRIADGIACLTDIKPAIAAYIKEGGIND